MRSWPVSDDFADFLAHEGLPDSFRLTLDELGQRSSATAVV